MSRIKSSVKMGQGRRRRGGRACCGWPAAGVAGQFEIAAVTPHRTWAARAAPGWIPVCKGVRCLAPARGAIPDEMEGAHDRAGRGGRGTATAPLWPAEVDGPPSEGVGRPPQPGTCGCPDLAGRGQRRARRRGRGTAAARHPRAPR